MENITFVVYHTLLPEEALKTILEYTESLKKKEAEWRSYLPEYNRFIKLLFASARKHHPGCHCTILTDQSTPFDLDAKIIRLDVDPARPAYMRLLAQIEYLNLETAVQDGKAMQDFESEGFPIGAEHSQKVKAAPIGRPYGSKNCVDLPSRAAVSRLKQATGYVIFLDYDMIIQENLNPIFNQEFDVALTYRDSPEHPINGGLMLVKNPLEALKFFEEVRAIYEKTYVDKFQVWGGMQRSLKDALKTSQTKVLLLPAEIYNFSTKSEDMSGSYPGKAILHYKGNRKKWL